MVVRSQRSIGKHGAILKSIDMPLKEVWTVSKHFGKLRTSMGSFRKVWAVMRTRKDIFSSIGAA
jgi:hypothetical protein